MKNKLLITLFVALLVSASIVTVYAQPAPPPDDNPWRPRFNESSPEFIDKFERQIESYVKFRIVLSSINLVLYGYLLFLYATLFNETRSKFSLGLMSLSGVLLIYSLVSNPLIYVLLRGTQPVWHIVFNNVPDVFATVAAVIMIYLTRT